MASPLLWHAALDTALVGAILGVELVTHRGHNHEQRREFMQKLLQLASQDQLTIKLDPAAPSRRYFSAAQALIDGHIDPEQLSMFEKHAKVPLELTVHSEGKATHFTCNLSMQELKQIAIAAKNLVDSDTAQVLSYLQETPVRVEMENSAALADQISANIPSAPQTEKSHAGVVTPRKAMGQAV